MCGPKPGIKEYKHGSDENRVGDGIQGLVCFL